MCIPTQTGHGGTPWSLYLAIITCVSGGVGAPTWINKFATSLSVNLRGGTFAGMAGIPILRFLGEFLEGFLEGEKMLGGW